jgi:energy-coupling factor transporter ATP-binding protein EcfA2
MIAEVFRRAHSASPVYAIGLGLLVLLAVMAVLPAMLPALPVAVAGTAWAMRKNRLPLSHFLRSRGAWLTALLAVAGSASWWAITNAKAGETSAALALGSVAISTSLLAYLVIEGHIMRSILELIPAGQRDKLDSFLSGTDQSSATGTVPDLSGLDPAQVTEAIRLRVIGQDAAVEAATSLIFRRARLRRPNKPIATLLFVGATGAGKTELSKAIADVIFRRNLIRVDCAELSQPQSTQRLIGAPPGYIGSDAGGWLCREIGRCRTGVILLDEIEKAHPDVLTTLMALLDEARLTEQATGTTYSATGFVIVMTSNAACSSIAQVVATTSDGPERVGRVKDELKAAGFRPEILARVDAVQPFGELSRGAIAEIVGLYLLTFAADVGVDLQSVDAALLIDLVQRREQVAGYGVREVVRLVEGAVVDGLLDIRDRGYHSAAIAVKGDRVVVTGVE